MITVFNTFNAFKAMRKKRNNSLYAEINTHKSDGYMSTSIWSYEEVKDMISHTARKLEDMLLNHLGLDDKK